MNIITNISSPNYDERPEGATPQFIIMHYIEMPFEKALSEYLDADVKLSPHYLIKKTGEIYNLVPDKHRAWHAGKSCWNGIFGLNDHSIGIEMDNLGNEPFTNEQMTSCIKLCHILMEKHNIHRNNVLGHSDIAPDRKKDPGPFFDWNLLDKESIGIALTEHRKIAEKIHSLHLLRDKEFSPTTSMHETISGFQQYLQNIGYDIEVNGKLDTTTQHVIMAFFTHFYPEAILTN